MTFFSTFLNIMCVVIYLQFFLFVILSLFWISVGYFYWIRLLVIFFRSKPASLPKFSVRNISAGNIFHRSLAPPQSASQLSAGYLLRKILLIISTISAGYYIGYSRYRNFFRGFYWLKIFDIDFDLKINSVNPWKSGHSHQMTLYID